MKKKIEVSIEDKNTVVYVQTPGRKQEEKAKLIANRAFRTALDSGCYLKKELNKKLIERGILSTEEEKSIESLSETIESGKTKLRSGGIELEEAKKIAVEMRKARIELLQITLKINEHEPMTVEGQSNNAYFDALVSCCAMDESGNQIFKSYDHYLEESDKDYAIEIAKTLSGLLYGTTENWEKDLPENKFLVQYGFMNDKLEFVREDGKRVTSDGKLINEDGRYVTEDGSFVDVNGNPVDKDGEPIVEYFPFLKNGQPV